ncbi:WD repeatcontaining protein 74, putative [Acanthamoeba castellanii str. Neff]|uniref:WD repeatcontaining protein 74, putative n=1 Tax=Acanthamoeba castellanii (strain ATCC 30010 / Neff) TaxID=1257118 RepID=L8HJF5_ACACF|nr:WD repeatcontaining protein 74, putative [Acanthamoeba castellanii str. Neff]ELR24823.1 WD repeatcontaining protein 74, putative [Acanthamoeba castellanii str. Neff]
MRAILATDTGLIKVVDVVREKTEDGSAGEEKVAFTTQWGATQAKSEEIHCMRAYHGQKDQVLVGRAGGRVEAINVSTGVKVGSVVDPKAPTKLGDKWVGVETAAWAPNRAVGWYTTGRGVVCSFGDDENDVDSKTVVHNGSVVKEFALTTAPIGAFRLHPTAPQAALGGKGVDLRLVEVENGKQVWTAKNVPNDFLDMPVPVWVTDLGFLPDDPRRIAVVTGYHQIRVYDVKAQRRPTIDFELKQLPHAFSCIVPSADPNVIALGDTHGNVVEIDLRNKNIKGLYRGIAGSVRSIAYGPDGKTIVAASLDRFLRVFSTAGPLRKLQHKVHKHTHTHTRAWRRS